ncbi:tetratricopeptide repeat protein [Streptomyces sp. NPDC086091]|uniref:tetratricopeptide repeat protein n=1 Tax=Streptomyces sp. NPDC086091 TaxID=3365751 RepID=UPI0038287238
MARTPGNEALFAARISKGWFSQERAVEGISMSGREALRDPSFTVSVRTYRRWESSSPGWPHPHHATALRAAFGKGPEFLGFPPPATLGVEAPADVAQEIDPMKRRKVLGAGAAIGLPWLAPSRANARASEIRVGDGDVHELRLAALDLDAIDQRWGGDRLWRTARSHLAWVQHLIDDGTYGEDVGRELHQISGQLTTSLGWFCYDANRHDEARIFFSEALNTALLDDDLPLATRTLSNMSRQSVDLNKPREAIRFAKQAVRHAAGWDAPPRVAALLAIRTAQGYARAGDELTASTEIKRAWRAFDRGPSDRDPEWVLFLNEAELTCLEGMCRSDLGQYRRAVRLLERSATLQNIEHSRNRGMCLARLATAAVKDRDVDRSISAARESLRLIDGGQTSTRNRMQLVVVREGLAPYGARAGQARDTIELLNQHIA